MNHIVIVGLGALGSHVVQALRNLKHGLKLVDFAVLGCSAPLQSPDYETFRRLHLDTTVGWWCANDGLHNMGPCRREKSQCLQVVGDLQEKAVTGCHFQQKAACLTLSSTMRGESWPYCYESMEGCAKAGHLLADYRRSADYSHVSRCVVMPSPP